MRKISFIIVLLVMLASCSNDELVSADPQSEDQEMEMKSAADKIFTVTPVASDVYSSYYTRNSFCTDMSGNLYYFDSSDYYNYTIIKKYDVQTGETTTLASMQQNGYTDGKSICVDNQGNIYYTDLGKLYKIAADGSSITDLTSRFTGDFKCYAFYGLCAADNGNVFISADCDGITQDGNWIASGQTILRLSAQGKVALVNKGFDYSDISVKGGGLIKPKGAFVMVTEDVKYLKAGTTGNTLEYHSLRNNVHSPAAALNKANPYAVRGNDIVQVRPNAATDLLVGTIPSMIADGQGGFITLGEPRFMCVDPDAKVFYIMVETDEYSKSDVYKLTLD